MSFARRLALVTLLAMAAPTLRAAAQVSPQPDGEAKLMAWQGRFLALGPQCGLRDRQWAHRLWVGLLETSNGAAGAIAPRGYMAWREGAIEAAARAGEALLHRWGPKGCPLFADDMSLTTADIVVDRVASSENPDRAIPSYVTPVQNYRVMDTALDVELASSMVECGDQATSFLDKLYAQRWKVAHDPVMDMAGRTQPPDAYRLDYDQGVLDEMEAAGAYEVDAAGKGLCPALMQNPRVGLLRSLVAQRER